MNHIFNVVIFLLTLGIFSMDLLMPLGVAAGTPYGLVVMITLWSRGQLATYLVAVAGIALTVIGFFLSPASVNAMHAVIINRVLAIVIIAASAIMVIQRKKADQKFSALSIQSVTDPVSKLKNRLAFDESLPGEIERARRYGRNLSLAMLDLDHFKLINDTFGHNKGDLMLRQLADELKGSIRQSDLLFRVGGDEFSIIFIETDLAQANIVCDKIRKSHDQLALQIGQDRLTLSIGLATLRSDDDMMTLSKRADDALYHAKNHGRNKVSTCQDSSGTQAPGQIA